jgi:hypothetical protein
MLGEAWQRSAAIDAAYVELLGWMTGFEIESAHFLRDVKPLKNRSGLP